MSMNGMAITFPYEGFKSSKACGRRDTERRGGGGIQDAIHPSFILLKGLVGSLPANVSIREPKILVEALQRFSFGRGPEVALSVVQARRPPCPRISYVTERPSTLEAAANAATSPPPPQFLRPQCP
jgi:hypothetical protein